MRDFYFIKGESVEQLNEQLETERHDMIVKIGYNTPSWHKIIALDNLKEPTTVAFYSGVTKWGYFWVLGFAKYEHKRFWPVAFTREVRQRWNDNGCYQPEFEQLEPQF